MSGPVPGAALWRPQPLFSHHVASPQGLERLNEQGGVAVDFRPLRADVSDLGLEGGQSHAMCLWQTRSATGFLTVPKIETDVFTVRFVSSGQMLRRNKRRDYAGQPGHAMFVAFEDMRNEEASENFAAISGTITRATLLDSHHALEGRADRQVPVLEPIAPTDTLAMQSFLRCFEQMHRRLRGLQTSADLFFPLVEEIICYQLLSCWPRRDRRPDLVPASDSHAMIRRATDYIDAHLAHQLRLADVAAAAGIGVRALQYGFKRDLGVTPLEFILGRRLQRVHDDLRDAANDGSSIADLARRWGFVHVSDFTQRYRRRFGCTPTQTRRA